MIKMPLRRQYDLKLHCVEGYSEDDDSLPYRAMTEQMLSVFSAFYSKNLSSETKRGKQRQAMRGEFNGSIASIKYDLVTAKEATDDRRLACASMRGRGARAMCFQALRHGWLK